MASILKWIKIIGEFLILIDNEIPREEAVSKVLAKFGVPKSEIWEHGNF
ncbi:hypothetical protein KUA25_22765 [Bacteroidales bacterium MSK.15.36]|nr:hypothetical protein [Bacteroidales bacterium MSK.15.36]